MIPICKPYFAEEEVAAAREVILSGWVTQGPRVKRFEDAFAKYVGAKYACAVSSCTTALHLALLAVGVKPGDIVITVSHSFIATANAIRCSGAEPLFVDIEADTFNISAESLEFCLERECERKNGLLYYKYPERFARKESPLKYLDKKYIGRIAAILPVHQIGMPYDVSKIITLANRYKLPVVEDAACAIGSEISLDKGKTFERIGKPHGDSACFSFHPRKVLTAGEGGMITTNNVEYDKYFRLLRQHGMSVSDIARHQSQKVIIENYVTTAYNYRMTDIQAAIGHVQLRRMDAFFLMRRQIDMWYRDQLKEIKWLQLPYEPEYAKSNWQSYAVKILDNSPLSRDELIKYLLEHGVSSKPGIMNSHEEPPYNDCGFVLKNSEYARNNAILFPFYFGIQKKQIIEIAARLLSL